jgi:AraC-like DNA-binding protein
MTRVDSRINGERSVKFWRVKGLRNLELLQVTHNHDSFPRRLHEGFEISVIESGAEKLTLRGSSHIAPAGSVVVINPGEVHTAQAADGGGWSQRSFYPTAADVRDAASSAVGRLLPAPAFSTPVIQDWHVCRILRDLHLLLELPNAALAQESYSIWVASQLVTRHADDRPTAKAIGKEHKAVKLVQDFIQAHYSENVTLARLASLTGLSSYHLIRVFASQVGIPPHAYLNQVRVNRARQLLGGGRSMAGVASETGFVDQSHMSKHFRRLLGVTPGQYASGTRGVNGEERRRLAASTEGHS